MTLTQRAIRLAATTAIVACLPLAARAAQTETERVDRTLAVQPGGVVKINNFSGSVTITGTSRQEVVVHAVRRATRDRLDHVHLQIDQNGNNVSIEANKRDDGWRDRHNSVVETDFTIEVPSHTDLDVKVFSSGVQVSGVEGRQTLHAFSGSITLTGATGPLDAETFSGRIDADISHAGVEPTAQLRTFSGDVDLKVAADARARVNFDTFSGDLESDLPIVIRTGRRRHTSGDLGAGAGSTELRFKTFSGDIHIVK